VAKISKEDIERAIGGTITDIRTQNEVEKIMASVSLFHELTAESISLLVQRMEVKVFYQTEELIREGTPGQHMYIIKSGSVSVVKYGKELKILGEGSVFGERSVLENEVRNATIVAKSTCECWLLSREVFYALVDDRIIQKLRNNVSLQYAEI
jgi:CRP-like cAMP-binding protein